MTPEVSRACSIIVQEMGLVSGPVMDELRDAAENAAVPNQLPKWATNVLAAVAARDSERQAEDG